MAITRIKNSTISNRTPKYNDVLAGLPFRPIIGTATDGGNGTSASVAFTGNNVANGTITYTALSSPGSFTGTGTVSPITVSGLTAGTAYTFQVKAGNSLGDSAYSAASNSVTPVTPTSYESIASATGTGSSATITFSSIPSTYQSLQLRIVTKGNATGGGDSYAWLRVNGATGAVYSTHNLYGNGASVLAGGFSSATEIEDMYRTINSGATQTNVCSVGIIDFHDYASTTRNKTIRAITGYDNNGAGEIRLGSGLYQSTTAISSISLIYQGGSGAWTTQTQVALYGVKGA